MTFSWVHNLTPQHPWHSVRLPIIPNVKQIKQELYKSTRVWSLNLPGWKTKVWWCSCDAGHWMTSYNSVGRWLFRPKTSWKSALTGQISMLGGKKMKTVKCTRRADHTVGCFMIKALRSRGFDHKAMLKIALFSVKLLNSKVQHIM